MKKAGIPRSVLLHSLFACVCLAVAFGQTAELPSAPAPAQPAKPSQPESSIPPSTPLPIVESTGAPPPGEVEEDDCYGPAEGIYAEQPKLTPEAQKAFDQYFYVQRRRMDAVWRNHMPNAANDPWVKGAIVLVRFAIMPDGSIDTPIVTLSSGRKGYDQHALQTVLGTAPFDPLPAGLNRPQPICMRFGYNKNPEPKKTRPLDPWELPAKPAP